MQDEYERIANQEGLTETGIPGSPFSAYVSIAVENNCSIPSPAGPVESMAA